MFQQKPKSIVDILTNEDSPNIKSPKWTIRARNASEEEGSYWYDQSDSAQKMMKGEWHSAKFTDISIPFPSSSPIKGAYICINSYDPPSHLIFTFTTSKKDKISKKHEFENVDWYFLPIDLPDVVLCEIIGKGREEEYFKIDSLVFISRDETPEEIIAREAREKLWSEVPVVKPEFCNEGGREHMPIPRDDPRILDPSFSIVKCKNDSVSKHSEYYDKSSEAQKMLEGESEVYLTHLSIPFPSPSPMKGAYICVKEKYCSPSLFFTFTDSNDKKTSKKFEFTILGKSYTYEWYFLPIDLADVILCEIEGKESWISKCRDFHMNTLVFIRDDDIPTSLPRSFKKVSSSSPLVVKPEFLHQGDFSCCPIPRDAPNIKSPECASIKAKDETKKIMFLKQPGYDQSYEAREMMDGEWRNIKNLRNYGFFTKLYIPFPSSSPMKGVYIALGDYSEHGSPPSHLILTLTSSKGEKISRRFEFSVFSRGCYFWYFLPVDLSDVVLCEITGKGRKKEQFQILSLVFFREETLEEIIARETKEKQWYEAPIMKTEFVKEGGREFIPISRDDSRVLDPSFSLVKCKDNWYSKESTLYDRSLNAQKMLKGESFVSFSNFSIPFPSPSPIKGAYICVYKDWSSPTILITFTDFNGSKIFKKYEFPKSKHKYEWYFLPIDLNNVVLCEIEGKGRWDQKPSPIIKIESLVFIGREETPEEIISREAKEKLWSEVLVVKSEFFKKGNEDSEGRDSIPISRDDPKLVAPSLSMVKCKDASYSRESEYYDRSLDAQKMLKGEGDVYLSHLSIPFTSPCSMKGVYSYVSEDEWIPSLLITFTNSDGKKTFKKYEFIKPKYIYEWHFLPIDLPNVVLCEIEGNGLWYGGWSKGNSRCFHINSLVFIQDDDITTSFHLHAPDSSSSLKVLSVGKDVKPLIPQPLVKEEVKIDKDSVPKDYKQKWKDKEKSNHDNVKYKPKFDSLTLTSASTLTSQCIIGSGGFGEVLLVKVDDIPFPCVLKKMLQSADEKVVKWCRKEFKVQLKLFTNPKCFNRIPRPLYILDLLDCDMKGVYGFLMEFCVGGSVSAFAKRWCADGKYVSVVDDSEPSDLDSSSGSGFESDDHDRFDPMILNPVKVCSLCVGMIECLDDVFTAKPKLVHRDVKPDNFLVRVDPKNGECTVVLADLGFVQIQDSVSSSTSSKSFVTPSSSFSSSSSFLSSSSHSNSESKRSICGTLVYNSYETLRHGIQSQISDGYSLGMIECLDDVFTAKPKLVHRDVKPDNFLVRVDPKNGECTVVLADLGFVQIQDSVSSSTSSKSFVTPSSSFSSSSSFLSSSSHSNSESKRSICGTLVYNSYETLRHGIQSQISDGYSLGMSILALFLCCDPFLQLPVMRGIDNPVKFMGKLIELMKSNLYPHISSSSPLFDSLLTIDDGKYEPLHKVFNEVFTGLTLHDHKKRMSVHDAREIVQPIKFLLPTIGEDFACPSIDDVIKEQKWKHFGSAGTIFGDSEMQKSIRKSHYLS
ncbi:hypothetical protein ADUPG1_006557 [Aduncisulcus paluster]|uniref:Protein kinase domain-containing protein n=1 Tax=Aduncisulcus paluster TaxID=2918883 RepID=A0ABQ5KIN6_9EUKA|nr:hypothetical protein ADUPG1_006557 [Aduncisulcus paluster]